jgi:SPP1 gp7 family putative phage head morphogenesis protein
MAAKKRRTPKPKPALDSHAEAIRWFRSRVPMRKSAWLKLDRKARERAFTVARVAKLDIIQSVRNDIVKALKDGENIDAFRKRVTKKLTKAWGEERAWHVDVIWRVNTQLAYAHGREAQMRDPEALEARPYWLFDAILDSRTTPICRPIHGTVLPAEHPFWRTHTPPCHFQCRSIKRALTLEHAVARGIARRIRKHELPQDGFGGADPLDWKPDLTVYDDDLLKKARRRRR